jgi:hypothetical protein
VTVHGFVSSVLQEYNSMQNDTVQLVLKKEKSVKLHATHL